MVNLGNPELAYHTAMLPNDGVGLAHMEFIINEHIGIHPMALVLSGRSRQEGRVPRLPAFVRNYAQPTDFFAEKLAGGRWHHCGSLLSSPRSLCGCRIPRPMNMPVSSAAPRLSQKKKTQCWVSAAPPATSHPAYAAGVCAPMPRRWHSVRNEMGLTNLRVMVPFCRRVAEGKGGDRNDGAASVLKTRQQRA